MLSPTNEADCPRLDTISYYDDSEPNWNERPYFTKVEEKRGRTGWHVKVRQGNQDENPKHERHAKSAANSFVATPGVDGRTSAELRECLTSQGSRILLSGIGGDE